MRHEASFLRDIISACAKIAAIIATTAEERFLADEILPAAVLHHLTVIGEAINRLSPDLRARHPEVPWSLIVAVRHRIVHAYFDLDWNIRSPEYSKSSFANPLLAEYTRGRARYISHAHRNILREARPGAIVDCEIRHIERFNAMGPEGGQMVFAVSAHPEASPTPSMHRQPRSIRQPRPAVSAPAGSASIGTRPLSDPQTWCNGVQ